MPQSDPDRRPNVYLAVPFFGVADIKASLRFYVDGLGFRMTNQWTPDGELRWCYIELDKVAVMLQQYLPSHRPPEKAGVGVSICFMCRDALAIYHSAKARGLSPAEPFVGNGLWVTSLTDPDGYRIDFESETDVPEDTTLGEWLAAGGASASDPATAG